MNIYIKKSTTYYRPILYVLKIIEKNKNLKFDFVDVVDDADFVWDHSIKNTQIISCNFYNELHKNKPKLNHEIVFKEQPIILNKKGQRDYIATIFYMINCLQEYSLSNKNLDKIGRFRFDSSYQFRFDNIEENLVQQYIDHLVEIFNIVDVTNKQSVFFISHDIDSIYGSFLQDGYWAAKNFRIDVILTIIANELIRRPHWKNIDKIIKLDNEFDVRSTFFWLVNKGKGSTNIENADYNISKEKVLLDMVKESGFVNGLHKSCHDMSINDELKKGEISNTCNRYHYLKYLPSSDWKKISDSKIDFDSSVGFSERYGFRNSYGMPFQPYDIKDDKPFNFVEAPLHFMDRTFHKYMKINTNEIGNIIIEYFERNQLNCLFSLLWHNTYFTDYKYNSFLEEYKKVMSFIYESKISSLVPEEIVSDNILKW